MIDVNLSEVAEVIDCEHKTAPSSSGGKFRSIRTTDISNGVLNIGNANPIDESTYKEWTKRGKPEKNDLILAREAPVGEVGIIPEDNLVALGQRTVLIKVKDSRVNPKFLNFYFGSRLVKHELKIRATGSVVDHLNMRDIRSFPLHLPPIAAQEAIAEVLSSLDDKIDLLKRQNNTLEGMAEALFRQWFIEEAQDDWDVMFLPEMCLRMGSGGTPSTKVKEYYEGSINWFATKELQDNFSISSVKMITQEAVNESAAKLFPKHTIMMAIYAAPTVGRLGILTSNGCFNQATCGFVAREEIGHEFIFTLLKNQREELNLLASGTAQQNLSVKKLKEFGMPLPDVQQISRWRDLCRPIFQKWEANFNEISLLEAQRDTLLPKLMSGEVRVHMD